MKLIKSVFNPWSYQEAFGYEQAVEVKNVNSTLYCAGQAAMSADGEPSKDGMREQIQQVFENLETLIHEANYELKNIVKLNIYVTSATEYLECAELLAIWVKKNKIKQVSSLIEVAGLAFDSLKVEADAIVVK